MLEYYHGLGVGLNAFYGLTDVGVPTMTRPGLGDLGTVGVLVSGYELRLAADGEILVRSDSAPTAYHNLPEETAATYAPDAWIRTGDIGTLDGHERLRIVDRKKELVIPDHGHNVAPSQIESELKSASLAIAHVCVLGDNRPYLAALIVLDPP